MRKYFAGFLIGIFVCGIIGVSAANYLYKADEVSYTPKDDKWNVNNVDSAINDLYDKINTFKSTLGNAKKVDNVFTADKDYAAVVCVAYHHRTDGGSYPSQWSIGYTGSGTVIYLDRILYAGSYSNGWYWDIRIGGLAIVLNVKQGDVISNNSTYGSQLMKITSAIEY